MQISQFSIFSFMLCVIYGSLSAQKPAPNDQTENGADKVTLAYQFQKGDVWRYQLLNYPKKNSNYDLT